MTNEMVFKKNKVGHPRWNNRESLQADTQVVKDGLCRISHHLAPAARTSVSASVQKKVRKDKEQTDNGG